MATRIFRVDLSEGEGDFTATATEPGLAMLDKQGANYALMQRWFGPLVAEPSWQGSSVNFYIQAEGGGRLEGVECYPVSKEDLDGPLKDQLMQIQARIKRAKPEEAAEVSLHRVVRSSFNSLTKDLDQSDYDCYFFKYRVGREPWKLVWGWGFQRADHEPAPGLICTNADCNQLFVRRANQRARCPGCEATVAVRRRGIEAIASPRNLTVAALLLLLLLGLFIYFAGQPQLVVEPAEWTGPMGSRVNYTVTEKSWIIFSNDVTDKIVAVSGDPRVMAFDRGGTTARAKGQGRASVTFQYQNLASNATVVVQPPAMPDKLEFEGDSIDLVIGATRRAKVWGKYDADDKGNQIDPIDFTELVTQWSVDDADVAYHQGEGRVEGAAEGTTLLRAMYQEGEGQTPRYAKVEVSVGRGDYKSLKVSVDPALVRRGENARVELVGVDAKGNEHSLTGSSQVRLSVSPESAATIDGGYLVGKQAGKATLTARLGEVSAEFPFEVSSESILAAGTFVVNPPEVALAQNEYLELEVVTADEGPIVLSSSDGKVVKVVGERGLVGVGKGTAQVTVKQGGNTKTVDVKVNSTIESLRIDPPLIALRIGQPMRVRVMGGVNVDGVHREVEVAPEALVWDKLPRYENAQFSPEMLVFQGVKKTTAPQPVRVLLGDELSAGASVTVSGGSAVVSLDQLEFTTDIWRPYPPVSLGSRITYGDMLYDHTRGGLLLSELSDTSPLYRYRQRLPEGAVITGIGDKVFGDMTEEEIRAYFEAHPQLVGGDTIRYRLPGSDEVSSFTYRLDSAVQEVGYIDAKVLDRTEADIQFQLEVYFDRLAEYRFTDRDGAPLSEWQTYGPAVNQLLITPKVPIDSSDSYILYIERKMDGDTPKQFPVNFRLK
ncbi:MAG: Ig-like domain-containing protein [Pirellulaceae bacterium]